MSQQYTKAALDAFTDGVTRALRRAAKTARKIAIQQMKLLTENISVKRIEAKDR